MTDNYKFLREHLEKINRENSVTVDPVARLRKIVSKFNENLSKCGAEVYPDTGGGFDVVPTENLNIEVPAVLTESEKLARLEAFATAKKAELGGLAVEFFP